MKHLLLLSVIITLFESCSLTKNAEKTSLKIVDDYKKAINLNDYNYIKPHLSNSLKADNMDIRSTWIMFYSYVNFGDNEKIKKIKVDSIKSLSNDTNILYITQFLKKGTTEKLEMNIFKDKKSWKINRISNFQPNNFTMTTRASFVNEDVFGDNPVHNISNLKILDKSKSDSLTNNYTIYYDAKHLKENAKLTLEKLNYLDSILLNKYLFNSIHRENILLTHINSRNTITIGKELNIPWSISLSKNKEENITKLKKLLATTYSHEIIEGTLLNKYNLKDIKFRWFRDGLSEYIAYKYGLLIDPQSTKLYFNENRVSEYNKNKQKGNLLDWRGAGINPTLDTGKLYGDEYIYENEKGQYGRAFMFFKDTFELKEKHLTNILASISNEKDNITVEKLLKIMTNELNEDIVKRISQY